jgi:putative ABC transport system permease protein
MFRELRVAARMLRKRPGFTAIAVVPLALGIGATTAVFSLIQGVLLTPPPYDQPDRLVLVSVAKSESRAGHTEWTAAHWTDWQQHAAAFKAIAGYSWSFNFLVGDQGSQSIEGMYVTDDYFRVTGLRPILGRTFLPSEAAPNAAPVIVIGYNLWQRTLNGDPAIVGKTLRISRMDTPPTVVGVMPPAARFLPTPGAAKEPNYDVNGLVDFWMPAAPNPKGTKAAYWDVVGRLTDGVRAADAQAELTILTSREAAADRDLAGFTPLVRPLIAQMNAEGQRVLLPLFGAAALVLLIGCGNTAALLLVRGLQRQQEYAIRIAMGVRRSALFAQTATETLLLSVAGAGLGLALAVFIVRLMKVVGAHAIPRMDAVTVGWPVMAATCAIAVGAAALAGVVPALRAARLDPNEILKNAGPRNSGSPADRRLLRVLTVAQTALTLALLVGAGLLVRTMRNVWSVPAGYSTDHILTMTVTAVQGKWLDFHQRALERVAAIAGVERAAFAWGVPLTGTNWPGEVEIEGHPVLTPSDRVSLPLRSVTPGYFALIGLPIVEGRDFSAGDNRESKIKVAIVNHRLAERYFPNTNAIGKKIWQRGRDNPPLEIVGVVADSRPDDLTRGAEPEVYLPLWQASAFSKDLIVRTAGEPRAMFAAIQRELRATDPTVAIENARTLDEVRVDSVSSRTFVTRLLVGFSVVAVILTLVGVYGMLSLSVASRRREIAIRSAIGAQRRDIRNLVFGESLRLVGWGLAAGITAALALARVWRVFLFGVQPADPLTLAAASLLFVAVSLLACWAPTARATSVDPLEALRSE